MIIKGGSIITGDGRTVIEKGTVQIEDGLIVAVSEGDDYVDSTSNAGPVIDAEGSAVIPGVINGHAHGCIHGPSMPSGSEPMPEDRVEYYRNRHLLEGTTTLLNVCGLALPEEIDMDKRTEHPLQVHVATAHTPGNLSAAESVDGKGLSAKHKSATVDQLIDLGAKALGEVGGGQTLGGGAQDYKFIPLAIKNATGIEIDAGTAGRVKMAVLGPYLDGDGAKLDGEIHDLLSEVGLEKSLDADSAKKIIHDTVMPPVKMALQGFSEIAEESARTGYPAVFHNATPSAKLLVELAEKHSDAKIVAGHSNHPMFRAEEAVHFAKKLKERGASIDVSTLDCIETNWLHGPENIDALISAGCVDTLSTDFCGSHWDGILKGVHRIIKERQLSEAAAVALATGNVARVFPQLAGDRGLIEKGKRADIVITDRFNIGRVQHVIIEGRLVVENGVLLRAA